MTPRSIWVAELFISPRTADKVVRKHQVEAHELHDAIVCVEGLRGRVLEDPERGERVGVHVVIRGRSYLVVLYPDHTDPFGEAWSLASAYAV